MTKRSEFTVRSGSRVEFIDVTSRVAEIVERAGKGPGFCHVFIPHTTAAVTVNENADPDVVADIIDRLEEVAPAGGKYRHSEGNSPAHVKASLLGASEILPVEDGRLVLGTWQGVYFCEFDGPRSRRVVVTVFSE